MTILAIDSSAVAASAALLEEGKLLGEFFIHTRLTHSQTLMPMVDDLLRCTQVPLREVGLFAVSAGPGSFTGIRIGIASIKGLAMEGNKPCVGVSTLEAMAENLRHLSGDICAVMDARCGQVYNAVFRSGSRTLTRLTPDRAISIESLAKELKESGRRICLVGDGADLCYNSPWFTGLDAFLPPEALKYQRASSVAQVAARAWKQGTPLRPTHWFRFICARHRRNEL